VSLQRAAAHTRAVIPRKFVRVSSRGRTRRDLLFCAVSGAPPFVFKGGSALVAQCALAYFSQRPWGFVCVPPESRRTHKSCHPEEVRPRVFTRANEEGSAFSLGFSGAPPFVFKGGLLRCLYRRAFRPADCSPGRPAVVGGGPGAFACVTSSVS
jgi:hypothetical protein